MHGDYRYEPKNGFAKWLDSRLPIIRFVDEHLMAFPTPKNLNYWFSFGGILAFMLAVQIATGIVLAGFATVFGMAMKSLKRPGMGFQIE